MSVTVDISACCEGSFLENCCCPPCTTPSCNTNPPACSGAATYTFDFTEAVACANAGIYPDFTFQVPVKPCRGIFSTRFDMSGVVKFRYNTKLRGNNHATSYRLTCSLSAPLPNYPACSLYINITDSIDGGITTFMGDGTTPFVSTHSPINSNPGGTGPCADGGFRTVCIVAKSFGNVNACCTDTAVMLNVTFRATAPLWNAGAVCCADSAFGSVPLYQSFPPTTTALPHVNCGATGAASTGRLHGGSFACVGAGASCGVNCNDTAPSSYASAGCGGTTNTCAAASCTATRITTAGFGCCNSSGPPFTCPPGGNQAIQYVEYHLTGSCSGSSCEGACC